MRVLFVCEYFAPAWNAGGTVTAAWNLTRALARAGADVRVVTTDAHVWPRGSLPRERMNEGVRITTARIARSLGRRAHRFGIAPGVARDLVEATREADACVMQGLWTVPVALASRICTWRRVPYVLSAHGTLEEHALATKAFKKRVYWRLIASRTVRRAAAVHFTSDLERERSLRATGGAKVVVVPNAFEPRPLEPRRGDALRARIGVPADARLLGMSGRIHAGKGFDVIVPALARCRADVHLVVFGSDHERVLPQVLAAATASGVRQRVHVLGHLEPEDLHRTYASIDMLVLPSRGESFGNVIVESIAQGTPVLLSDRTPLASYVRSHRFGGVVQGFDPATWAKAVDHWFDSAPDIDREDAARRITRDFDLHRSGVIWMDILKDVASRRAGLIERATAP